MSEVYAGDWFGDLTAEQVLEHDWEWHESDAVMQGCEIIDGIEHYQSCLEEVRREYIDREVEDALEDALHCDWRDWELSLLRDVIDDDADYRELPCFTAPDHTIVVTGMAWGDAHYSWGPATVDYVVTSGQSCKLGVSTSGVEGVVSGALKWLADRDRERRFRYEAHLEKAGYGIVHP